MNNAEYGSKVMGTSQFETQKPPTPEQPATPVATAVAEAQPAQPSRIPPEKMARLQEIYKGLTFEPDDARVTAVGDLLNPADRPLIVRSEDVKGPYLEEKYHLPVGLSGDFRFLFEAKRLLNPDASDPNADVSTLEEIGANVEGDPAMLKQVQLLLESNPAVDPSISVINYGGSLLINFKLPDKLRAVGPNSAQLARLSAEVAVQLALRFQSRGHAVGVPQQQAAWFVDAISSTAQYYLKQAFDDLIAETEPARQAYNQRLRDKKAAESGSQS